MKTNALIAGSSGLVGSELLKLLSSSAYYSSVHLLVRKSTEPSSPEVIQHSVDFFDLEKFNPGISCRDVYICLGTTHKKAGGRAGFYKVDHDIVMNVARWAKAHGAERLSIVSSIGADAGSRSFYLKTKGQVEEELQALGFRQLIILRPSLLLGNRQEYRWAEALAAKIYPLFTFALQGRLKKYRAVQASKVAEAMFHLIKERQEGVRVMESDEINDLK
jgi:uncharacterized protein YbjT (DUF2867 family)